MAYEDEINTLKAALAGGSIEAGIEAVLALPDGAVAATASLENALGGPDLRLDVALLDALFRLNADPQVKQQLIAILDRPEAAGDDGEELYMMARIALNRVENDDEDVLSSEDAPIAVLGVPVAAGRLAVIVHGTWARDGKWWRPGGDFHKYLLTDLGLDYLYNDDEPFVWSGRNRHGDRFKASEALATWVMQFNPEALEVYAHSHGANVAMLATHQGLEIEKLVMMSPPVRKDYFARWEHVGAAFNIQASFDPVVAVARGGQSFAKLGANNVLEKTLPSRSHSASHDPGVWEANGLPAFVGLA